jgi:hypothetical protein
MKQRDTASRENVFGYFENDEKQYNLKELRQ